VNLAAEIPGIHLDIRYHTANNFTGTPVPGYGAACAWMLAKPAKALVRVQKKLQKNGFGLVVFDAYRPHRATVAFVAWAQRSGNAHLVKQHYIGSRSYHNHGIAIDLGLVDLATGQYPDMGTEFDTLSPKSHTANAQGAALKHRMILKKAMESEGFRNYRKEWWHFSYWVKGTRPRDVPYGGFEAAEGVWTVPKGWDKPGWKAPASWPKAASNPRTSAKK